MTQEIINRLKELLGKTTKVRDEIRHRDKGDGEERYDLIGDPCGFPVATFGDANDALFDLECRKALSTLTNLTPSGVERIRAEAFEQAAVVADYAVERAERDWHNPDKQDAVKQVGNEIAEVIRAYKTRALPSEPPSQGDVEGRARELPWRPFKQGETPLDFGRTYLCAAENGNIFVRCLTAGVHQRQWAEVSWILDCKDIPRPASKEDGRS